MVLHTSPFFYFLYFFSTSYLSYTCAIYCYLKWVKVFLYCYFGAAYFWIVIVNVLVNPVIGYAVMCFFSVTFRAINLYHAVTFKPP